MDTEDDWSNSVRIFPTLKKNCYTIPVDKAGQRILVIKQVSIIGGFMITRLLLPLSFSLMATTGPPLTNRILFLMRQSILPSRIQLAYVLLELKMIRSHSFLHWKFEAYISTCTAMSIPTMLCFW